MAGLSGAVCTLLTKCGARDVSRNNHCQWAEGAGVNPAASVHWLRHAHASHAIDNGAPITLVSATLGHADLKTTSVYAHAGRVRVQGGT
jgi:site-specific recombinase XerD